LAGKAAPLPYQLELAAITADIEQMKQCDEKTFVPTNHQMPSPTNIQLALAALSAKIAKIMTNRPTVPPQLDRMKLPDTAPMPVSNTVDLLHDDNGNHPHDI